MPALDRTGRCDGAVVFLCGRSAILVRHGTCVERSRRLSFPPGKALRVLRRSTGTLTLTLVLLACSTYGQTPATGTVTIPSVPSSGWCDGFQWGDFWSVTVNGVSVQFTALPQSQSWTTAALAQSLAANINSAITS